jgi:pyrroline-5-carboxylate reductase
MNIAFIGGGNMAGALIGGLLARGAKRGSIRVVEPVPAARRRLAGRFKVRVTARPDARTLACDTLVLAVKPQDMRAACAPLAGGLRRQLVISIAAGIRLKDLQRWLGGHAKLVRCMPNTPALIGAGITGLYANAGVGAAERRRAERLLGAGESLGLAPEVSRKLALQTVLGAAQLAAGSKESPAVLRERVTSKGGTTAAALAVFDEARLAEHFRRAVEAASRRGTELGELLGRD